MFFVQICLFQLSSAKKIHTDYNFLIFVWELKLAQKRNLRARIVFYCRLLTFSALLIFMRVIRYCSHGRRLYVFKFMMETALNKSINIVFRVSVIFVSYAREISNSTTTTTTRSREEKKRKGYFCVCVCVCPTTQRAINRRHDKIIMQNVMGEYGLLICRRNHSIYRIYTWFLHVPNILMCFIASMHKQRIISNVDKTPFFLPWLITIIIIKYNRAPKITFAASSRIDCL